VYFIQAMAEIGGMFGAVRPWQGASILSFSTLCIWPHSTIGQTSSVNIPCRLARPQGGASPPHLGCTTTSGTLGHYAGYAYRSKSSIFGQSSTSYFAAAGEGVQGAGNTSRKFPRLKRNTFAFCASRKKAYRLRRSSFFVWGGGGGLPS